jgi:hypothetical protein
MFETYQTAIQPTKADQPMSYSRATNKAQHLKEISSLGIIIFMVVIHLSTITSLLVASNLQSCWNTGADRAQRCLLQNISALAESIAIGLHI